jgi:hypothetical protein
MKSNFILSTIFILAALSSYSQDKKFYIFLSFGQSNMEGNAPVRPEDTVSVDSRFKVMEAVDCPNLNRTKGQWYTAIPPLCRCHTGITLTDFFGRTMIANLPKDVTVGIINVSVGGCKIELFDEEHYQAYLPTVPDWLAKMVNEYDGNPYRRLVEMAKLAQRQGVIKGILLHQGESNTNDTLWPQKVKVVYDNLLRDLDLSAASVPLLAGELVHADQGGKCASMNTIIDQLPNIIPTAHVISSSGCTDAPDDLHFNAEGYRMLGKRYAEQMLVLLGVKMNVTE